MICTNTGNTAVLDGRDHARNYTETTGTGVPIYWLNGSKIADNYAGFYDGGWDDEANPRNEAGELITGTVGRIWTGCNHDGTAKADQYLGATGGRVAYGNLNHSTHGPLSNSGNGANPGLQGRLYAISPLYAVREARIASAAIASTPRNTTRGYFVGEEIRVRIRYNEPVAVTPANDPPSVWLKVDNEVRRAWYASGSGTADLVFAYTVQSGDVDTNGVSLCSDTSLHGLCGRISLNGGTIEATADDTGVPLNYPEMSDQAAHGIGGPQVIGVAMQSAPASGDTYAAAETVTVRLTFAEAVDVTGTPFVYLNVGGAVRKAVLTSDSGSANLDFSYTVQASDFDANGVSVCSNRLLDPGCGRVQLDGGAIVARADALVADLVLPVQDDQSGHKVDGTPVTIDPGGSTMVDPGEGTVPANWSLHPEGVAPGDPFRLIFVSSSNRNATSSNIDDYNRFVIGAAGGGHADIVALKDGFRALASSSTVDARDNTGTTGTGVPIYWLNGNKVADDDADFYDNSWDDESNVRNEDGNAEADTRVWTGSLQDGTKKIFVAPGASLPSRAYVGRPAVGTGLLRTNPGGPIDSGAVGATNTAQYPLYGLSQVLRALVARATDIRIVSRPPGGRYAFGEAIAVQATFSAPVAVRGVPGIDLQVGERVAVARYVSGSGTDRLRFEYVIMLGDYDENGIGLSLERDSTSPFRLDGAAIVDTGLGDDTNLRLTTLTSGGANHRVEARPPAATGVSMASSPASGDTYGVGETVTVRLAMRADVTVVLPGRPHVWLEVGGAVRRAEYSGPVGSATRALEFSYTVQEGDLDTDGVRLCSSDRPGIDCGRIHLNGGTIRASRGGLDAVLGTPRQGAQAGHKVDATGIPTGPSTECAAEIKVRPDWALVPSGVAVDGKFRLLFITSTTRGATDGQIGPYNQFVQGRANAGHSAIRPYGSGVRVIGSSAAVNARTNTCTTGAGSGIGIYWLNGSKVADSYSDLYDGSWDNRTAGKNELGNARSAMRVWTGTNNNGTTDDALGSFLVTYGDSTESGRPLDTGEDFSSRSLPLYGLSQVFTVRDVGTTDWSIVSTPAADNTYRRGETIEVAVDFSEAVAVLGEPVINFAFGDDPNNLAGQVGVYLRGSGTSRLIFGYQVAPGIRDTTGFQFSDKPIELRGGTIRAVSDRFHAVLTIPAWSALEPSQNVDGGLDQVTGGICERTQQVRDALVAAVQANDAAVTDCSLVTAAHLDRIAVPLRLVNQGIEALKPGDFADLGNVTELYLDDNALSALPAGVCPQAGPGVRREGLRHH